MTAQDFNEKMDSYVANEEISGAAFIVRQKGKIDFKGKWGYSDISAKTPIEYDSIYRMMSMTKPITAVCVMQLIESGKIGLEDPVCKYIPEFKDRRVAADKRYALTEYTAEAMGKLMLKLPFFKMDKVETVPAGRDFTIRDLLSHSSGLEQGVVGMLAMLKMDDNDTTLRDRVIRYTDYPLDFEPGTGTGYSPLAGFDILGYIISLVSGESFEAYLQEHICKPLEMENTTFFPSDVQKDKLVHVYKKGKEKLVDVTGTKEDMRGTTHQKGIFPLYEEGSGGLFSTLTDYEHFARMLCDNGTYDGKQILKPETVALMHKEGSVNHLEPEPGCVWGLGMKIRENPKAGNLPVSAGTYGWSGAFGTHFFVSPADHLEAVFMTNRSDLGGSGSYISSEVEKLVFGIWGGSH